MNTTDPWKKLDEFRDWHFEQKKKRAYGGNPISPYLKWSGREDLNLRPLDPQSSALTRLRYVPNSNDLGMCAGMR